MSFTGCKAALYIHIPFCAVKCDYCDFYSVSDLGHVGDVLENISRQLDSLMSKYGVSSFSSVYIGGGTPGIVPPDKMAGLLEKVRVLGGGILPVEVTMECNPRNISDRNLETWISGGINRISLGVQSFQDTFLQMAGRRSSRKAVLSALDTLDKYRDRLNLSLDLIQGLPGMTSEDQIADLKEAVSWKPDHLSWYSLILEPDTPLYDDWDRRSGGISADDEEVWQKGCRLLSENGYKRYEISNFCLPGRESVHNSAYWKMRPYMGCGPAGVSMLRDNSGLISRFRTKPDVNSFGRGELLYDEVEELSPEDFLKDYLLMGLRIADGISRKEFREIFSMTPEDLLPASSARWRERGCLNSDDASFRCSEKGMDLLNSILIDFFDEIESSEVPVTLNWPLSGASD